MDNHSINSEIYTKTCHQNLEEVPRTLVPEKMPKIKNIKKLEKIANNFF